MSRIHERRRIYALLDDRLSPRGREALDDHLQKCEACRTHLEQVREARSVLSLMGEDEPEMNWARVDAAIDDITTAPREVPGTIRWPGWALGTALAAAAAVLVLVVVHGRKVAQDEEATIAVVNPEVEVEMTLLDSLPRSGRLTLVGQGTRWKRPGLGWQDADLETEIMQDTVVETSVSSAASVQLASLSGVRLEPMTSATFHQITRDIVRLDLEQGTLSVKVHSTSGLRDVRVYTDQAVVRVSGTTLSVDKTGGMTRVVVAKGRATVHPAGGGEPRIVEAPDALTLDDHGVSSPGTDAAQAKAEVQRLRSLHFNFFEGEPSDAAVAFAPQGAAGGATVSIGKKLAGLAPLTMLAPEGMDEATLAFQDGSTLETHLDIEPSATTIVNFSAPVIKTEPSKPKPRLASKIIHETAPKENIEEQEQEQASHTGFLAPQIVKMVLKKQHGRLRDCYQKYLDREPAGGIVKARIRFTIGTSGKVLKASSTSNGDGKLEACLAGATSTITFPPPSGGTIEFEYPITFAPK
ncbi:MAG: AgmX/PglI C-terminal domain-containing protein [Deltaproteobacteria bacterium]|nr:AgmX/PglI C-terminal domain-containing protein [Deltaproteobacteria bacterium]